MEKNWVQTIPGKGWNVILRLYGALVQQDLAPGGDRTPAVRRLLAW